MGKQRAETFQVAVVQDTPAYLELPATVEKTCRLIAEAAERGAHLVAFPEAWISGYPIWLDLAPGAALWNHPPAKRLYVRLVQSAVEVPGPEVARIGEAARAAGVVVVLGVQERAGGSLYCSQLFIGADGRLLGVHRKLMPTYQERLLWGQGDGSGLLVVDTPLGKVGGLLCWEHWMPLARQALHERHELIHVACWPAVQEMHQIASRHYAFEGRCFVLAAGTVLRRRDLPDDLDLLREIPGEPDDFLQVGGSAIIGPDGSYLAGPVWNDETILLAEINPERAIEERLTLDVAGHYNRPDVFEFSVRVPEPTLGNK